MNDYLLSSTGQMTRLYGHGQQYLRKVVLHHSLTSFTKVPSMTVVETSTISPASPTSKVDELPRVTTILRPGDGKRVRAFGNEIEFKLSTEQTGGSFTLGLATVPAGRGAPPHVHLVEDELFLILEGEYRFTVDGESAVVGPGGVVFLPRGTPHTFQVVGPTPGKHWVMNTPSGFDRYFERAAEVFAAPGPPDFARLAAISAEHGYAFVGRPASGDGSA